MKLKFCKSIYVKFFS